MWQIFSYLFIPLFFLFILSSFRPLCVIAYVHYLMTPLHEKCLNALWHD